jgi:hypothetical protein
MANFIFKEVLYTDKQYITKLELAEILHCSLSTISRQMLPGKSLEKDYFHFGRKVLFPIEVVKKIENSKGRQKIAIAD